MKAIMSRRDLGVVALRKCDSVCAKGMRQGVALQRWMGYNGGVKFYCIHRSWSAGDMLSLGERDVKSGRERWVIPERGRFMKWFHFTVVLRLSYYDAVAAYLLGYLVDGMDVHNRCVCHVPTLTKVLNRHRATVYRKLNRLQDLRLIQQNEEDGRMVVDINPSMVNRSSKVVLHHFTLPMQLPSDQEIDQYFAKCKKVPEVKFNPETGEIYE